MWAFIIFNIFGALFFYWLIRVPKGAKKEKLGNNNFQKTNSRASKASRPDGRSLKTTPSHVAAPALASSKAGPSSGEKETSAA